MRIRHRVPTIFSLSMLDVLCCALGAVILLMILNFWDARRKARAAESASQQLRQTQGVLAQNTAELEEARSRLQQTAHALQQAEQALQARREQIARLESEARTIRFRLEQARQELATTRKNLASSEEQRATVQADLAAARLDLAQRERQLQAMQTRLTATDKQRREAEASILHLREQTDLLNRRVKDLDAEVVGLRKQVDQADLRLSDAQKQHRMVQAELAQLRKRAEEAEASLTSAQKESQPAQDEMSLLRKALDDQRAVAGRLKQRLSDAESRFAGVDLSGRRVVFLVDMSGSMGSVDTRTPDPNKWPEVCRTVVHVLRSMPEVEQLQIILFADEARFLLGSPGQWLAFDRQKTPEEVARALARVQPRGDTNMYTAFAAAFRFRSQGLDTIFLFSDGLPNTGPGLPHPPPRDEATQSALLGRYLRDTIRGQWNRDEPRIRINAIGFFYESPNLGAFLWALTRENGGSFVGMSKP